MVVYLILAHFAQASLADNANDPYEAVSDEEVATVSNLYLLSFLLVSSIYILSRLLDLQVENLILSSAIRCFIQISFLGLILVPLIIHDNRILVFLFIILMIFMAAVEASLRPTHVFPAMTLACFISLFISTFVFLVLILYFALETGLRAQYAVPLAGMIIGQGMEAISVAMSKFITILVEDNSSIEAQLALGANRWEACAESVRQAIRVGLSPTLTFMAVAGLVFIPELMTGHIIGGTNPQVAGHYQLILIYIGVGTALISSALACLLTIPLVIDAQGRFRSQIFSKRESHDRVRAILAAVSHTISHVRRWRRGIHEDGVFPRVGSEELIERIRGEGRRATSYGTQTANVELGN